MKAGLGTKRGHISNGGRCGKLRNRKSPGEDHKPNKLLKYGRSVLVKQLQKIIRQNKIPDDWRRVITV